MRKFFSWLKSEWKQAQQEAQRQQDSQRQVGMQAKMGFGGKMHATLIRGPNHKETWFSKLFPTVRKG